MTTNDRVTLMIFPLPWSAYPNKDHEGNSLGDMLNYHRIEEKGWRGESSTFSALSFSTCSYERGRIRLLDSTDSATQHSHLLVVWPGIWLPSLVLLVSSCITCVEGIAYLVYDGETLFLLVHTYSRHIVDTFIMWPSYTYILYLNVF